MIRVFHLGDQLGDVASDYRDWVRWSLPELTVSKSGLVRLDKEQYPELQTFIDVYPRWWYLDRVVRQMVGKIHDKWVMQHLPGGAEVLQHVHNKWGTIAYYPESHECKLTISDDEESEPYAIPTRAGDLVVMPAGTRHGVQANDTERTRLSFIYLYGGYEATQEGVASLARPQIAFEEDPS